MSEQEQPATPSPLEWLEELDFGDVAVDINAEVAKIGCDKPLPGRRVVGVVGFWGRALMVSTPPGKGPGQLARHREPEACKFLNWLEITHRSATAQVVVGRGYRAELFMQ